MAEPRPPSPAAESPARGVAAPGLVPHPGGVPNPAARPPSAARRDSDLALSATVDRLREELDGLRAAMRSRAVIEQAKGMFMERYGCTDEEAFARLATFSQQTNVKLADVAYALVSAGMPDHPDTARPGISAEQGSPPSPVAAPSPRQVRAAARRRRDERWPRQAAEDPEFASRVRDRGRRLRLRSQLLSARSGQEVIDVLVGTGLEPWPPTAAVLAVADVSGALELLGSHGVAASVAVRWQRLPIDLDLPVCEVARAGRPMWWDGRTPSRPRVLGFGIPEDWDLATAQPLHRADGVSGVLVLTWSGATSPTPGEPEISRTAREVTDAVQRLTRPLVLPPRRRRRPDTVPADPAFAVLDVLFDPVILCEPVIAADRTVADLVIRHVNPAAAPSTGRTEQTLPGRQLLEVFPDSASNGLLAACLRVWESGEQVELHGLQPGGTSGRDPVGPAGDVRLTRYRRGVLITWANTGLAGPARGDGRNRHA